MKKLYSLLFVVGLLASSAFGQTLLTNTTLSAAVTDGKTTYVNVTSATGITAPGNGSTQTYLYVDSELMDVRGVSGTRIQVVRGASSTAGVGHLSGARVWVGTGGIPNGPFTTYNPSGACTRANVLYLPVINTRAGMFSDCVGGQWVAGSGSNSAFGIPLPNTGGTAYTAINTNGTTLAATTMYCTELSLPASKLVTGLGVLNGTTVGTDNHLVVLYDSAGNLLANSAVAGVLAASASTYQKIAFTSPYLVIGPATYFGCVQTNGTAATVRMIVTGTQDTFLTKGVTSITFGTIPATITVPTTFTTAVGPYLQVY